MIGDVAYGYWLTNQLDDGLYLDLIIVVQSRYLITLKRQLTKLFCWQACYKFETIICIFDTLH